MNYYSPSEFIKNAYSLIITKIFYHNSRLIRRPIYIRGKKSLCGAKGLTTGRNCRFDLIGTKPTLHIGDNCEFGDMTHIVAYEKVVIGSNVLLASKCFISDTNHGSYKGSMQDNPYSFPKERKLISSAVVIEDNVWIGENVVVLAGSKVGKGSIIGANSVVSGEIPEGTIAVGVPARLIKKWNQQNNEWEKICEKNKAFSR